MSEGRAGQVGVDERADDADLRQAEPAGEELGTVLHQQRDDVAPAESLTGRPVRVAIGLGVQLGVAGAASLEADGLLAGRPLGPVLHQVGRGRVATDELAHAPGDSGAESDGLQVAANRLDQAGHAILLENSEAGAGLLS